MKKYVKVTFLLAGEEITKYFQGDPTFGQIKLHVGNCSVIDFQRLKGDFTPDYIKSKTSLSGYTTN